MANESEKLLDQMTMTWKNGKELKFISIQNGMIGLENSASVSDLKPC